MNILVKLASGFMNLFTLGGEQFVSWVTGIIPTVLMLLLLMNAIIALAGNESVNKLAKVCTKNPVLINASELFVWLGIANGISALNLDTTPLAVRYLLVGLVANFISGWVTEFTTRYVEKQQGVKLSRTLKA